MGLFGCSHKRWVKLGEEWKIEEKFCGGQYYDERKYLELKCLGCCDVFWKPKVKGHYHCGVAHYWRRCDQDGHVLSEGHWRTNLNAG